MADNQFELLAEGYRRGILPPDMKAAFEEAQKRGLFVASEMQTSGKIPSNQPLGAVESLVTGMQDPLIGGRQLLTHATGSPQDIEAVDKAVREREAGIKARGASGLARGVGAAITTAPLMAAGPAGMAGAIGAGAVSGALQPTTGQNFLASKVEESLFGAAFGGLGTSATRALGAAIAPSMQKGARALTDQGVELTPGQASGGIIRRLEEAAKSLPILGNFIREGEKRSIESFNRSVLNQVLEPIGEKSTAPIGHDAIAQAGKKLGSAYDSLLPNLSLSLDQQLASDIAAVRQQAQGLTDVRLKQFNTILDQRLAAFFRSSPTLTGETLKKSESEIRTIADRYRASPDADQRDLASSLDDVRGAMRDALLRQNPSNGDLLKAIDTGWAMLVRAQSAATRRATSEGVFTANDLLQTIKSQDKSVRKGSFARGDALMQLYAEAGQKVLPGKMPDSGTPERLRAFDIVSGAAALPFVPLYTKRGLGAASSYMQSGPVREGIRRGLRGASPYVGIGAAPTLTDLLDQAR